MSEPSADARRSAPAALRNRQPIAEVLRDELPKSGLVFEIASGTGEHVVHFAREFLRLEWQPSDPDAAALASIAAWRENLLSQAAGANLRAPLLFDVRASPWPEEPIAAILCINMVHISPPDAAESLFAGAGRALASGAPLLLYGPFTEEEVPTATSNLEFDHSLKSRDPRWGLRDVHWMDALASRAALRRTRRVEMPANNLLLVYRA